MTSRRGKGKRPPPDPDFSRMKAVIYARSRIKEAEKFRDSDASKGLALHRVGKIAEAKKALESAEFWDRARKEWEEKLAELEGK
jgi:hypothetical protein